MTTTYPISPDNCFHSILQLVIGCWEVCAEFPGDHQHLICEECGTEFVEDDYEDESGDVDVAAG